MISVSPRAESSCGRLRGVQMCLRQRENIVLLLKPQHPTATPTGTANTLLTCQPSPHATEPQSADSPFGAAPPGRRPSSELRGERRQITTERGKSHQRCQQAPSPCTSSPGARCRYTLGTSSPRVDRWHYSVHEWYTALGLLTRLASGGGRRHGPRCESERAQHRVWCVREVSVRAGPARRPAGRPAARQPSLTCPIAHEAGEDAPQCARAAHSGDARGAADGCPLDGALVSRGVHRPEG